MPVRPCALEGCGRPSSEDACSREHGYLFRRVTYYTAVGKPFPADLQARLTLVKSQAPPPEPPRVIAMAPAMAPRVIAPPEPLPLDEPPARPLDDANGRVQIPAGVLPSKMPSPVEKHATIEMWPERGIISDGDNHFSIADPAVHAAKLAFARDVKPSLWVNVGDLLDCWFLSRFEKEAGRLFSGYGERLQDEIDSARPYVEAMCGIVDESHWIEGNHEQRLARVINANPGLHKLRSMGWKSMLEYPENFRCHPHGTRLRAGSLPLFFIHGDAHVPPNVANPANYMLTKTINRSTIFGHTHKLEAKHRAGYDENGDPVIYGAYNQGHGSLVREQTYAGPEPDWQHGFTYTECYTVAGKARFNVHLIAVVDGRFSFGGKVYDGNLCQ